MSPGPAFKQATLSPAVNSAARETQRKPRLLNNSIFTYCLSAKPLATRQNPENIRTEFKEQMQHEHPQATLNQQHGAARSRHHVRHQNGARLDDPEERQSQTDNMPLHYTDTWSHHITTHHVTCFRGFQGPRDYFAVQTVVNVKIVFSCGF